MYPFWRPRLDKQYSSVREGNTGSEGSLLLPREGMPSWFGPEKGGVSADPVLARQFMVSRGGVQAEESQAFGEYGEGDGANGGRSCCRRAVTKKLMAKCKAREPWW